ncbi:MAG: dynamin family protein [Clostridia bacterium]|nr:dynamin family protein [Clostridia bacterium]
MGQVETAEKFVDAMLEAASRFKGVKTVIDNSKQEVQNLLDDFEQKQRKIIDDEGNKKKNDKAEALFQEYKNTLEQIVSKNKERYVEYLNGTKFINKFEETFIVSVFGKVKSGKSYLGNYIMGNSFRSNGVKSAYDKLGKIIVTVQDKGTITTQEKLNEIQGSDSFGVDSIEATSTIQYFTIGGLTWFDTPGIGSITKENEELAEEYIKNSDLIVFCMNSDAAGTAQEISELKVLYDMHKPLLLLVTQSDTEDEDWDDELCDIVQKTVPKTDEQRRDVENYLKETVRKMNMGDVLDLGGGSILTISTKLAVKALEEETPDQEMYDSSNIDFLMNKLINITKNDAADMKLKNPKDRFNSLITELRNNMSIHKDKIAQMNNQVEENEKKSDEIKRQVVSVLKSEASDIIKKEIEKGRLQISKGAKLSGEELLKIISEHINEVIADKCSKAMKQLVPDIEKYFTSDTISFDDVQIEDLGEKTVSEEYRVDVVKRRKVQRGPFGKIVEFFCGEKYETYVDKETRTMEISLGDNSLEIQRNLLEYFENVCSNTFDKMISDIIEGCNRPLKNIAEKFASLTEEMEVKLEEMKIK